MQDMLRRLLPVFLFPLLLLTLAGCGNSVNYTLSQGFRPDMAATVAVMPVLWDAGEGAEKEEIGKLFRSIAVENLRVRGYGVKRAEAVDSRLQEFIDLNPGDIASALGVDAVLFLHVNKWKTRVFANYAALNIEALYTLYSSRNSATLWSAIYATGESDIRFDKATLKLSIIEIYEPRIARLTNSVFDTLPVYEGVQKQERLYDWLP